MCEVTDTEIKPEAKYFLVCLSNISKFYMYLHPQEHIDWCEVVALFELAVKTASQTKRNQSTQLK